MKLLADFRGTHGTGTLISARVVKGKAFTSPTAAQARWKVRMRAHPGKLLRPEQSTHLDIGDLGI